MERNPLPYGVSFVRGILGCHARCTLMQIKVGLKDQRRPSRSSFNVGSLGSGLYEEWKKGRLEQARYWCVDPALSIRCDRAGSRVKLPNNWRVAVEAFCFQQLLPAKTGSTTYSHQLLNFPCKRNNFSCSFWFQSTTFPHLASKLL